MNRWFADDGFIDLHWLGLSILRHDGGLTICRIVDGAVPGTFGRRLIWEWRWR